MMMLVVEMLMDDAGKVPFCSGNAMGGFGVDLVLKTFSIGSGRVALFGL